VACRCCGIIPVEDLELDVINWGDIKLIVVVNLPLNYCIIGYNRFKLLFD